MEYLPEQRRFSEFNSNATNVESLKKDVTDYLNKKLRWELETYRLISFRMNWLLERINVTLETSEDGARYMKVEFIPSGNTKNDNNNWRFLLKSKDEDGDGIDEIFDVEFQMRRSGTWTTADIWHG